MFGEMPTEKILMGHVSWIREMLQIGIVTDIQWCDTREMTADGHNKGCIDRKLLIKLMHGIQTFQHATQKHQPFRGNAISRQPHNFGGLVWFIDA